MSNSNRHLGSHSLLLAVLVWVLMGHAAQAQNMGMVFSPVVNEGESTVDYRIGYQPDGDASAQRIQYKYGMTDRLRLGGIIQFNQNDLESFAFQFVRFEAMCQMLDEESLGIASAIRVIIEVPGRDDAPYRAGAAWSGQWDLDEYWQARGNVMVNFDFGQYRTPGLLIGGRAQISRRITRHVSVAFDYFGGNNDFASLGNFDENLHQVGPLLALDPSQRWNLSAGVLFGVSNASPDVTYRINLQFRF
jgi:hypothetical protein